MEAPPTQAPKPRGVQTPEHMAMMRRKAAEKRAAKADDSAELVALMAQLTETLGQLRTKFPQLF